MSADQLHPAKREQVSALLNTSADDASVSLKLMLDRQGAAHALEICAAALVRLDATQAGRASHRKAFATTARRALKQLEKGPGA